MTRWRWNVEADAVDETDATVVAEVLAAAVCDERNNPDEPVDVTHRPVAGEDVVELPEQVKFAVGRVLRELVVAVAASRPPASPFVVVRQALDLLERDLPTFEQPPPPPTNPTATDDLIDRGAAWLARTTLLDVGLARSRVRQLVYGRGLTVPDAVRGVQLAASGRVAWYVLDRAVELGGVPGLDALERAPKLVSEFGATEPAPEPQLAAEADRVRSDLAVDPTVTPAEYGELVEQAVEADHARAVAAEAPPAEGLRKGPPRIELGKCANHECRRFEYVVAAEVGDVDVCSECGQVLVHESGLTWADAAAAGYRGDQIEGG